MTRRDAAWCDVAVVRVLFVDHEDSFAWNVVALLAELGHAVDVLRPHELGHTLPPFERLVLGPGPGGPQSCTATHALLLRFGPHVPTLGVCLGHQLVALACGASVGRANAPVHGHAHAVHHDGRGLFAGLPSPFAAGRYHSLIVREPLPASLAASAHTAGGELMALRHHTWPVESVQFHPESVLSEHGHALVSNFVGGAIGGRAAPSGSVHSGQGPLDGRRGSGASREPNTRLHSS
jgi:anthranilate synthase/aminodeoxychorismate synthase-like glutamine amidotransferase